MYNLHVHVHVHVNVYTPKWLDHTMSTIINFLNSWSDVALGTRSAYMIGEHIPPTDEHWQNYLQLLQIVDLLFAPSISEDEVGYLSVLITEHHQKFVFLYSNSMLLPKHHYMIHMPPLILQ